MEIPKDKLIVIKSVALIIIALGIYLILYRPLIKELSIKHSYYHKIEAQLAEAHNSIEALKTLGIKRDLANEENLSLAIDELTKQGKSKGLVFVSIRPQDVIAGEGNEYKILPVRMEIESDFQQLALFLGSLEKLEKSIVKIKGFNMIPDNTDPLCVKTELTIHMYLSSEPS